MKTTTINNINYTVLSLNEWLSQNKDLLDALVDKEEECEECDGVGSHTCSCGDEHDCSFCDGTGIIKISKRDALYEMEEMYRKQCLLDAEKLAKYIRTITGK